MKGIKKKVSDDDKGVSGNPRKFVNTSHIGRLETYHLEFMKNKWIIKKETEEKIEFMFNTREEALSKAREMIKNMPINIFIHKEDGTVEYTL